MQALEEKLQYHFKNPALLEEALRHSSYANEHRGANFFSNERLEFLGDSVLGFVTAEYLFAKHPTAPEGVDLVPANIELSGMEVALVNAMSRETILRQYPVSYTHLDVYKRQIYKTIIPRNVKLAEAPSYGLPITIYDGKSAGAESYRQLAQEVIQHEL